MRELPRDTTMERLTFEEVLGASGLIVQKDCPDRPCSTGVLVVIWELGTVTKLCILLKASNGLAITVLFWMLCLVPFLLISLTV